MKVNLQLTVKRKKIFDPRRADQQFVSSNSVSNLFSEIRTKTTWVIFKSLPKLPPTYESQEMAKNNSSRGGEKTTSLKHYC